MARQESLEDEPWLIVEPDPGSLSQLCSNMGVQGVQVEQICSLNRGMLHDLRPIHGITLLLHHKPERSHRDDGSMTLANNVYFANQVVHEAYAIYALLSVLMNCNDDTIDLGSELIHLKEFTDDFPPMLKGLSVTNSKVLKDAHNSVARRQQRRLMRGDDIYHYITYIPIDGYLWELDGFKRGPLRLASCTESGWIDTARTELQRKIELYQRQQIPFTIWSVIEDRRRVYQRQLAAKAYMKRAIEQHLEAHDPSWRVPLRAQQWEEEYRHALQAERCKRGTEIYPNLDTWMIEASTATPAMTTEPDLLTSNDLSDLQAQIGYNTQGRSLAEIMDFWLQVQDDSLRIYKQLGEECQKHQKYQDDVIRRQHDYTPFIKAYLQRLLVHGHLERMIADLS
ncbi:hypothetical protein LRAMOSA09439 [Lichtheimia ramosa]|uniref:ubiquitinyl hydrolase 1 n=1 Tax=Lichtheimia ramosa TaxID=688394 RepID=A0A077WGW6_9FUNG|nr:hypothetical protein LRAMOSA09439 [Lichtheimia ramosa]